MVAEVEKKLLSIHNFENIVSEWYIEQKSIEIKRRIKKDITI